MQLGSGQWQSKKIWVKILPQHCYVNHVNHRQFHELSPLYMHGLSPGQIDQQVVVRGRKLNLHWVAKWTSKFPCKYMQVATKTDYPLFHWLIIG